MIDEGHLADLLLTWEERFDQGDDVPADLLCQDSPELAGILAERIVTLKKTMWVTKRIDSTPLVHASDQFSVLPLGLDFPVIVSQYRLDHFIAEGGFGQVWRGFDLVLERPVAVKVPRSNRLNDVHRIERFLTEARRVARLRHPNIVPVYNVVRNNGAYFIILDLIEGKDLRQRMMEGPLPVREVVRIVLDVADAVEYAHGQGVIHRDIKPANILIDAAGSVFITDFGIASTVENEPGKGVYGTLPYMSPEQRNGAKCDARSDVYSLGGVLYELLTGDSPVPTPVKNSQFKTELQPPKYSVEDFGNPCHNTLVDPSESNSSNAFSAAPPILLEICRKSITVDPATRFGSAQEFADALRRAVSGIVTENDWITCTDSSRMLAHMTNLRSSGRKMRLLACAFVGPERYSLGERSRNAVLIAEAFADGNATEADLKSASDEAWEATDDSLADAFFAAAFCAEKDSFQAPLKAARFVPSLVQCNSLRDLFGPIPFRPKAVDPIWISWENNAIANLAKTIYEKKAFQKMPDLGDLLEKAGCTDQEILTHCRTKAWHNKGCWVVDLLLGKS